MLIAFVISLVALPAGRVTEVIKAAEKPRPESGSAPNQRARRLGAEVLLLGDEGGGGLVEGPGRLRSREEVDVDAADAAAAELDVAGTEAVICRRLLAAADVGDQLSRDDACSPSAKTPALGSRRWSRPRPRRRPGNRVSSVSGLTGM